LDELFAKVLEWGGAITGEHGIGIAKQRWWSQAVPAANRRLHAALKAALDPRGVVNPDKFVK
jgi:glycolate oxidase